MTVGIACSFDNGRAAEVVDSEEAMWCLAGRRDHITPPEQVWALADHVSTPPTMISRRLVDAGHLGLFMGTAALRDHWSAVFADLAALPIG